MNFREKIHYYLNQGHQDKTARFIDFIIYGVIFIDVIDHGLQTMDLFSGYHLFFEIWDYVALTIFITEYILRVYSNPNRIKFVFSFWGIIDMLAIIGVGACVWGHSVGALREIRVLRFLSLFKYEPAAVNLYNTFSKITRELIFFSHLTVFLLYVSAVGIYYFENPTNSENFPDIFHSMWWAVATLTTVGYGDVYPITDGGRLFASFVVFIGLGIVAVPAGLIAGAFADVFKKNK
tara:strand:+ start:1131 stop:1835 length:705 start_codon:yes stop_codon:yes gene_type:complete